MCRGHSIQSLVLCICEKAMVTQRLVLYVKRPWHSEVCTICVKAMVTQRLVLYM